MDLLAPLDTITTKDITKDIETKIPIPSPDYLKKNAAKTDKGQGAPLTKYAKQYEEFCRWAAMPKDVRDPESAVAWERKHMMPKGYTNFFKAREDFNDKRLTYFWEWMMDLYPDVVYAVYKRAIGKSSKDAGIFIDLLSKKMNLDKPRMEIQPMVLVGVPQDKIDKLFVPKDYEDAKIIPGSEVKKE